MYSINTPYDDVFRTLLTDCTELVIPVVNEVFHMDYTGKEEICLLQNEHFVRKQDGNEQERITDSYFEIMGKECRRYHMECQSTEDGSILVRMFEYDSQIALENRELKQGVLTVNFPESAIVSLRHGRKTPDIMTIRVVTPGGDISYEVPVLKVKQYTVEDIFKKKLLFLIPFHIFSYEKDFPEMEKNDMQLKQLKQEYAVIADRLEEECSIGNITEYTKVTILEMSKKVLEHIALKYNNVKEGVQAYMGGKILEYEAKDILNQGRAEGRAEGHAEGREEERKQIAVKLLLMGSTVKYTAEATELPEETVMKLEKELNNDSPSCEQNIQSSQKGRKKEKHTR